MKNTNKDKLNLNKNWHNLLRNSKSLIESLGKKPIPKWDKFKD
jgi:hypothetical protein